jgi:hypothetical protein
LVVIISCLVKQAPGPLFEQLRIPFTKGWFVQFDWYWPAGSGEEDFFQYKYMKIWFSLLWSLPTPGDHDFNKVEFTWYLKAFMCMSSSGLVVLKKKIFKWPHPHFCNFLPFKDNLALYLKNLGYIWILYPRMIYTKFDWNWPTGSGEEDFLKLFQCIFIL